MLTEKQRQRIIDRLALETSDAKLATKYGVSRTTVWRLRREEQAKVAKKRAKPRPEMKKAKETIKMPSEKIAVVPAVVVPPPPVQVDVLPKVDAEPVVMGTYFAVQLLRCEHMKEVASVVMRAAEQRGMLFRKLQVMDFISVGTSSFVRFRSDLQDPAAVLGGLGRHFIAFADGNYRFMFSDGRQGVKFPTTIMCSVGKAGFGATWAGPKLRRWAQQFQTAS